MSKEEDKDLRNSILLLTPNYFHFLEWLIVLGGLEYIVQKTGSSIISFLREGGTILVSLSFIIVIFHHLKFSESLLKLQAVLQLIFALIFYYLIRMFLIVTVTQIASGNL